MPTLSLLLAGLVAAHQPATHPCVDARDVTRPVAAAAGQPRSIAVVTTAADAAAGRRRAWIADTATGRCLGFVEPAVGAANRWIGFAPRPALARVPFPGAPDSAVGSRDAAVLAVIGLPSWTAAADGAGASTDGGASTAVPAALTDGATSTPPGRLPNDPIGRRYIADFRKFADQHWAAEGANWPGNYYDRALIYYQAWRRIGDPEYRRRADAIVVDYRTKYLEKNNYGSSPHWAQLEGLAEHYRLTKDEASRTAVLRTAGVLALAYMNTSYMKPSGGESRIAARVLHAQLLAWELADRGAKPMWAARIDSALTRIAAWQAPDGSYPAVAEVCGGQLNYMVGLLNDVLIKTYEQYRADPKILGMVRRATDYLWTTQWVPSKRAFQYASVSCPRNTKGLSVGSPSPAPDLNNLFVTSFGWLYRTTGDARYRAAGEQIFAGGVEQAYLTGTKQFNENYTSSFRYLDYR